ncbi:MAG: hypothetical protein ACRD13_01740, partial [Terriglobales bacterium]
GTVVASRYARRGFQRTVRTGYVLIAIGLALLPLGGPGLGLAAVAVYGLGLGLVIPALNLQTAERHSEQAGCAAEPRWGPRPSMGAAAALSWLNFAWGAGAVASPLWVAGMLRLGRPDLGLALLAVLAILAGAVSVADRAAGAASEDEAPAEPAAQPPKDLRPAIAAPTAGVAAAAPTAAPDPACVQTGRAAQPRWGPRLSIARVSGRPVALFAVGVFIYVALETAIGGWAAMLGRGAGWAELAAVLLPVAFWGGLLVGRAAAPALLRRATEIRLAFIGLIVAAVGLAVLAASHHAGLWCGMALAGLGLAAQFPLLIAAMGRRVGPRAAASTLIFAMGGLGGAAGPWLVGQMAAAASLRAALVLPALAVALLFALWAVLRDPTPGAGPSAAAPRG